MIKDTSKGLRVSSMLYTVISGGLLKTGAFVADVLYKSVRQLEPAK